MKKQLTVFIFFLFSFVMLSGVQAFSQTVYVTQSGQHYHTSKCKLINKNSQSMTVSKAQMLNYTPCDKCHPPTKESSASSKKRKTTKTKK